MLPKTPNPFAAALNELRLDSGEPAEAKQDPLIPVVTEVLEEILATEEVVTPIELLVRLEILTSEQVSAWRRGQLPYLERGITAGLHKVGRILRILASQAGAKGLIPTEGKYWRSGKGPKRRLRFTKRGDAADEAHYSRNYVRQASG